MFSKRQLLSGLITLVLTYSLMFNGIVSVKAQDIVLSNRIGGGSSVFVTRTSRKAKKRNYAPKRRSRVKRTKKQRRVTRRKVVRQSRRVAKKNRVRRKIKKITPKQFKEIKLEEVTRASKEEASKILAGAGEYYVHRDEFEKAVGYLEQAVELDENNKDAKHALSETYTTLTEKVSDEAENFAVLAAKARKEGRNDESSTYSTQAVLTKQRVEKNLKRAIELNDQNSSAFANLGQYYDDEGKDDLAFVNYKKALAIDPELSNVKAPLGILYYQKGEISVASRLINEAFNGGEDNAEIQYFKGLIHYKNNENNEAKQALQKSITMDTDNAEVHYYLGATLVRLGDRDRAILEYKTSTTIDPSFVNAWFDLGVEYYNRERYKDAEKAFENAIRLNRNQTAEEKQIYAESHANLAETYRQMERFDLALGKYRNAVDLLNDPELYSTYGFALIQEEKWIDGIKSFEKVTTMTADAVSFANLGWAHYQVAQYHLSWNRKTKYKASLRNAKAALETAIIKNSNFAPPYLNLGYVLNDLGENKAAIDVLEKANSMQKNWNFAINALANVYQKNGDLNKAIKQFEKAIKLDKNNAYAQYGLGETLLMKGELKAAKKVYKKLQKLDSNLAKKLDKKIKKEEFNRS